MFNKDAATLLTFMNQRLKHENADLLPRDDYKEFLELAKQILGETPERQRGYIYTIQRPRADIHARWMSKSQKPSKAQFAPAQVPWHPRHTKRKLEKMTLFILFD